MSDLAKIELSKDLIEPIVRAQLQASITAALGRADQLVGSVVQSVMNTQVDSNGQRSTYGSAVPLITWMAESAIKDAAKEAIKEWFADNRDKLKVMLKKEIEKNAKGMAEAMVLGVSKSLECKYTATVDIRMNSKG